MDVLPFKHKKQKHCVFCGGTNGPFNDEHAIPQWLIALTGDKGRYGSFLSYIPYKQRYESQSKAFMSRRCPACMECNSTWKLLEDQAKEAVVAAMEGKVSLFQLGVLFDWLDKIRIGYWLNYIYATNNYASINPNGYISNYVGRHDSFIWVFRATTPSKTLRLFGVDHCFHAGPDTFGLVLNNLVVVQANEHPYGQFFPDIKFNSSDRDGGLEFLARIASKQVASIVPMVNNASLFYRPRQREVLGDREIPLEQGYYSPLLSPFYQLYPAQVNRIVGDVNIPGDSNHQKQLLTAHKLYVRIREVSLRDLVSRKPSSASSNKSVMTVEMRKNLFDDFMKMKSCFDGLSDRKIFDIATGRAGLRMRRDGRYHFFSKNKNPVKRTYKKRRK